MRRRKALPGAPPTDEELATIREHWDAIRWPIPMPSQLNGLACASCVLDGCRETVRSCERLFELQHIFAALSRRGVPGAEGALLATFGLTEEAAPFIAALVDGSFDVLEDA